MHITRYGSDSPSVLGGPVGVRDLRLNALREPWGIRGQ